MNSTPIVFQDTTFNVVDHSGQPWLRAAEIAVALGYSRADKISRIYSRHADEFTDQMTAIVDTPTSGVSGNLLSETRIFSLRGAHLLAMFARTPVAVEFRRWVLDILDREVALPSSEFITPAQAGELAALIMERFPERKDRPYAWSRFNNHFRIARYRELPAMRFDEACGYIRQMPSKDGALSALHPPIDVRALLLEGQKTPEVPVTDDIRQAIDRKAFALAYEAFDLCREHLLRRVAYRSEMGGNLDRERALEVIEHGDLNYALAHSHYNRLSKIAIHAEFALDVATEFYRDMSRLAIGNPRHHIPVIRSDADGTLELTDMQWWLLPFWSKEPKIKYTTFNARIESVATNASFREPFKRRRCLIPAHGWYEWRTLPTGKEAWYFHSADGKLIAFAGLWDRWNRDELVIESCTIIVGEANPTVRQVHDRMPLIMPRDRQEAWLDPSIQGSDVIQAMLQPAGEDAVVCYRVSKDVGNVANDYPELLKPIDSSGFLG